MLELPGSQVHLQPGPVVPPPESGGKDPGWEVGGGAFMVSSPGAPKGSSYTSEESYSKKLYKTCLPVNIGRSLYRSSKKWLLSGWNGLLNFEHPKFLFALPISICWCGYYEKKNIKVKRQLNTWSTNFTFWTALLVIDTPLIVSEMSLLSPG